MNTAKSYFAALPTLLLVLASPASAQPSLQLGFTGPDRWSSATESTEAEYFCTVAHQSSNPDQGIEGWSISIRAENALITSIDIEGTRARELFDGGFEQHEVTQGAGNEGAISAVILSFFSLTTLPVNTTSTIARIKVRGGPQASTLEYFDNRRGRGQPVPNIVTVAQKSNVPVFVPFAISAAVVPPPVVPPPVEPPLEPCSVSLGDKISGVLATTSDRDAFGFSAIDGTLVSLKLKGAGTLPPGLELRGPTGESVNLAGLLVVKKSSASFKNLSLPSLGAYTLLVNGVENAAGSYALALKGKAPKSKLALKTSYFASAGGPIIEQSFSGLGGATLNATLKGKGVMPEILELLGPGGNPVALGGTLIPGAKAAKIKNLVLPATSLYVLRFRGTGPEGAAGSLALAIKQKAARGRVLSECAE